MHPKRYIATAFAQKIFRVAERHRKPSLAHHRKAEGVGRRFAVLEAGRFERTQTLFSHPAPRNQSSSNKTIVR